MDKSAFDPWDISLHIEPISLDAIIAEVKTNLFKSAKGRTSVCNNCNQIQDVCNDQTAEEVRQIFNDHGIEFLHQITYQQLNRIRLHIRIFSEDETEMCVVLFVKKILSLAYANEWLKPSSFLSLWDKISPRLFFQQNHVTEETITPIKIGDQWLDFMTTVESEDCKSLKGLISVFLRNLPDLLNIDPLPLPQSQCLHYLQESEFAIFRYFEKNHLIFIDEVTCKTIVEYRALLDKKYLPSIVSKYARAVRTFFFFCHHIKILDPLVVDLLELNGSSKDPNHNNPFGISIEDLL